MADAKRRHVIANLSGGRNGYSPPWEIADNECADAVNVDFYGTPFARKRGGSVPPPGQSGITLSGIVSSVARHVPSTDATHAELWATDDAATPNISRLAGPVWMTPPAQDAPTGNGWDFSYASINGKLMIAYQSGQPRMHLWDGSTIRRAGIAASGAAPASADTGAAVNVIFDNAGLVGSGSVTSLSGSFTIGTSTMGSTCFLLGLQEEFGYCTGITYNGVALTKALAISINSVAGIRYETYWFLGSATPGTHPLIITNSAAQSMQYAAASYKNTNGFLGGSTFQTVSAAAAISIGIPTVYPNAFVCGFFTQDAAGAPAFTAAANTTIRGQANGMCWADGNQIYPTPTTAYLGVSWPTASNGAALMAYVIDPTATYAAVQRYYRVRWTRQVSGITLGRSEPSPMVAATPNGSSLGLVVTAPAPPGESETHWELEASIDGVSFYRLATLPLATTTYTDTALTSTYPTHPLSALTGFYSLLPAAKYIAADQNRLLTFGSYTATDKQNDIIVSAVIGASDVSDEERVDTTTNYRIGLDEQDSGVATGLIGPVNGSYLAFKDRQTFLLTATGNVSQPYNTTAITKTIGAVGPTAMDKGEDGAGNACAYWMSHRGLYRWGLTGLQYLGRNMEDYLLPGGNSVVQINLAAAHVVAVVRYFPDKRQVWCWWATGTSDDPNQLGIYDVITGGWTRVPSTDQLAKARCAVAFANTLGTVMSRDLKPYVGIWSRTVTLAKADTGTDDFGTPFQAYVVTKAIEPGGPGFVGEVGDSELLAKAANTVTISKLTIADFGAQTKRSTVTLAATDTRSRVRVVFHDAALSNVTFVQHQIGDGTAVSNTWTLERLITPMGPHGAVSK